MTVTRFAPSPTGFLHLGHAFAALTAARAAAGPDDAFLLRIEDLDAARARPEFTAAIFDDLAWLGLGWRRPVLRQSARLCAYRAALDQLAARELLYPCFCSRKQIADEIERAAQAPALPFAAVPGGPDGPLYPGSCRSLSPAEREKRIARGDAYALRLDAGAAAKQVGALHFREQGENIAVQPLLFGDVVLARKEVPAAYHLAVVVDDAFQNVDLVTRGQDLLPAAHIQRLLQAILGLPVPAYAHHRLILDVNGRKFSKRDHAQTLAALRQGGVTPAQIAQRLGL